MTEIAYHPTRVRALRESFRALRTTEFPWTADTVYLNNASIGPIPERTRRALDQFTAKRTAPWISVFPGLAIGLVVLGFNLFGDGLRDAMDPRLRGRVRGALPRPE